MYIRVFVYWYSCFAANAVNSAQTTDLVIGKRFNALSCSAVLNPDLLIK